MTARTWTPNQRRSAAPMIATGVLAGALGLATAAAALSGGLGATAPPAATPTDAPSRAPSASPSATASPSPTPTRSPSATARPSVSPGPTADPTTSLDPSDPAHTFAEIRDATGQRIRIEIADRSDLLVATRSGTPGAGASVPNDTIVVENGDSRARTLVLTWSGATREDHVLTIDASGRTLRLSAPVPTGDAMALDRVLVLEFANAVPAGEVAAFLQEGMDTGN